jgi:transcriptional regulator with GAF, ATPase, and Fis domain
MPGSAPATIDATPEPTADGDFLTEAEMLQQEKRNLIAALKATDWQIWGDDGAAAQLGIKPSTLTYRMKKFAISKDV